MSHHVQVRQLGRNYVPIGERVDIRVLRFRRTKGLEIFRCVRQAGYKPKSGPTYCGNIAEYIAPAGQGRIVCLCKQHPPPRRLIET